MKLPGIDYSRLVPQPRSNDLSAPQRLSRIQSSIAQVRGSEAASAAAFRTAEEQRNIAGYVRTTAIMGQAADKQAQAAVISATVDTEKIKYQGNVAIQQTRFRNAQNQRISGIIQSALQLYAQYDANIARAELTKAQTASVSQTAGIIKQVGSVTSFTKEELSAMSIQVGAADVPAHEVYSSVLEYKVKQARSEIAKGISNATARAEFERQTPEVLAKVKVASMDKVFRMKAKYLRDTHEGAILNAVQAGDMTGVALATISGAADGTWTESQAAERRQKAAYSIVSNKVAEAKLSGDTEKLKAMDRFLSGDSPAVSTLSKVTISNLKSSIQGTIKAGASKAVKGNMNRDLARILQGKTVDVLGNSQRGDYPATTAKALIAAQDSVSGQIATVVNQALLGDGSLQAAAKELKSLPQNKAITGLRIKVKNAIEKANQAKQAATDASVRKMMSGLDTSIRLGETSIGQLDTMKATGILDQGQYNKLKLVAQQTNTKVNQEQTSRSILRGYAQNGTPGSASRSDIKKADTFGLQEAISINGGDPVKGAMSFFQSYQHLPDEVIQSVSLGVGRGSTDTMRQYSRLLRNPDAIKEFKAADAGAISLWNTLTQTMGPDKGAAAWAEHQKLSKEQKNIISSSYRDAKRSDGDIDLQSLWGSDAVVPVTVQQQADQIMRTHFETSADYDAAKEYARGRIEKLYPEDPIAGGRTSDGVLLMNPQFQSKEGVKAIESDLSAAIGGTWNNKKYTLKYVGQFSGQSGYKILPRDPTGPAADVFMQKGLTYSVWVPPIDKFKQSEAKRLRGIHNAAAVRQAEKVTNQVQQGIRPLKDPATGQNITMDQRVSLTPDLVYAYTAINEGSTLSVDELRKEYAGLQDIRSGPYPVAPGPIAGP